MRDTSSSEQFSTHVGVYCVVTWSLLKHTDSNVTEYLTKISLFLEDCAIWGLSARKSIY